MKKFLTLLALLLALTMTCAMAQTTYLPVSGYSVTTPDSWDLYPDGIEGSDWLGAYIGEGSNRYYAYIGVYPNWGYDESISDSRLLDIVTSWVDGDEPHDAWLTTYNGMRFGVGHQGSQDSEANEIMYFCFRNGNLILIGSDESAHVPTDAEAEATVRQIVDGLSVLNGGSSVSTDSSIYTGPSASGMALDYGVKLSYPASWGIKKSETSDKFAGAWLDNSVTGAGDCYFCVYVDDYTDKGFDSNSMSDAQLADIGAQWGNVSERFYTIDSTTVNVGGTKYALVHCGTTANSQSSDSENWQLVGFVNGGIMINLEIDNDSGMFNNNNAAMFLAQAAAYVTIG